MKNAIRIVPIVVCALFLVRTTAIASILTQTISPFTGSTIQVKVTLDDAIDLGNVRITVAVVPGVNTGDLRGLWLDISDDTLFSGLSVINGPDITQAVFGPAGAVDDLGNGANLNGGGTPAPFDMGFEIGGPGIGGGDDFQSTTFTLTHNSIELDNSLFAFQDLGVRVTCVGPLGDREGSSKLGGTFHDVPIISTGGEMPEPISLLVWCGLAVVVSLKRA